MNKAYYRIGRNKASVFHTDPCCPKYSHSVVKGTPIIECTPDEAIALGLKHCVYCKPGKSEKVNPEASTQTAPKAERAPLLISLTVSFTGTQDQIDDWHIEQASKALLYRNQMAMS